MKANIDQANHNLNFHDCISKQFPEKFFDWRITVLFYAAIHLLKALAAKRGKIIGDTHNEIDQNVNPNRPNSPMKITKTAWDNYYSLYQYSRTARYDGITDFETFELLKKADYNYCHIYFENFLKYVNGQGISIS